jgi:transposase-like protein
MTCHFCSKDCKRFGRHRNGLQRFRCKQCHKTFTEQHKRELDNMRLSLDKAIPALKLLLEGMSVRSVERVTEVHRDTILRLLVSAGKRCEERMLYTVRNLPVKDVQIDDKT